MTSMHDSFSCIKNVLLVTSEEYIPQFTTVAYVPLAVLFGGGRYCPPLGFCCSPLAAYPSTLFGQSFPELPQLRFRFVLRYCPHTLKLLLRARCFECLQHHYVCHQKRNPCVLYVMERGVCRHASMQPWRHVKNVGIRN